jgi:hypothetical protein
MDKEGKKATYKVKTKEAPSDTITFVKIDKHWHLGDR